MDKTAAGQNPEHDTEREKTAGGWIDKSTMRTAGKSALWITGLRFVESKMIDEILKHGQVLGSQVFELDSTASPGIRELPDHIRF